MEEVNLPYRIDELSKQVNIINDKIDKINEILTQSRIYDNTVDFELNSLKDRVERLEAEQKINKENIQTIKEAPLKKDAGYWQEITKTIFHYVIDAAILAVLIKIGLK